MRPAEDIKRFIKNLNDRTSAQMDERVLADVLRALAESEKTTSASTKPTIGRIIMKSPITKLAAAAVIIIAVVLSINVWDKSIPTAYALEQTIQATHSVRYLHIKSFMVPISDKPIECWVEFDPSGQIKKMRIHKPAWMDPADGETVIVWKDGKMEFWIKKKNFLFIQKDQEIAAQVLSTVEQLDPKHAAANILQAQDEGDTKVEIDEPENKVDPIVITATSLVENDLPFQRVILFVDQATKLLNSVELRQLKDGEYIPLSTVEFYDYDIPIDSKVFTLDDVPSDVMRIDQITQEIGLLQGDLTDNEIAVEVVRQFFEALIARDYAKAGQMFGGASAERIQKIYGHIGFIRIVSIGKPVLDPATTALNVPYVVEVEENGIITEWKTKYNYIPVRKVHGQPGRWKMIGGPLGM